MDHTKDGNLDISELENGLRPLALEKSELKMLFQSIDTSGDGTIRLLDWFFPHMLRFIKFSFVLPLVPALSLFHSYLASLPPKHYTLALASDQTANKKARMRGAIVERP